MDLQEEFNKLDLQKCFAIGIGLAALYWVLWYNDGSGFDTQIIQAQQNISKNQAALNQVREALDDKKKFEEEIKTITQNMKDFQRYFAPDMDTNKLQAKVSQLAEQHSLVVINLKPLEKTSEFPKYSETAVEFRIEGPFHNIMEFISSLTKMEKAIDFSKMNFKTTVKGDYPLVELQTTLVVYGAKEVSAEGEAGSNG